MFIIDWIIKLAEFQWWKTCFLHFWVSQIRSLLLLFLVTWICQIHKILKKGLLFCLDKSHIILVKQKGDILRDFDEGAFCGLCQGSFRRRSCYAGGAKRETIKSWQIEIQRPASHFLTVTTIQVIQTSFPDKRRNYRIPSCAISNDHFKGSASKNIFRICP